MGNKLKKTKIGQKMMKIGLHTTIKTIFFSECEIFKSETMSKVFIPKVLII